MSQSQILLSIVVDTNAAETLYYEKLVRLFAQNPRVAIKRERLDLGDFVFRLQAVTTEALLDESEQAQDHCPQRTTKQCIVVERKTNGDLASSLQDRRFYEQKARFARSADGDGADSSIDTQLLVLVEGKPLHWKLTEVRGNFTNSALNSALLSTLLRDRMPVLRTLDFEDTCAALECIGKRLLKDELCLASREAKLNKTRIGAEGHKAFARKRKNLESPVAMLTVMLSTIPGLGPEGARALAMAYRTLQNIHDASMSELALVQATPSRRLGPSLAAVIKSVVSARGPVDAKLVPDVFVTEPTHVTKKPKKRHNCPENV